MPPCIIVVIETYGFGTTFRNKSRHDWASNDPLLIAEGAFALANVLTLGRLLQTVVMVSGRLGVLAISISGMVGDIIKFLILFAMSWVSFTLGMTQLYRPFEELKLQRCQEYGSLCTNPAFIRFVENIDLLDNLAISA